MGLSIVQTCDRCKKTRELKNSRDAENDGWLKVALRPEFGVMRDEQPTLCPQCRRTLYNFVEHYEDEPDKGKVCDVMGCFRTAVEWDTDGEEIRNFCKPHWAFQQAGRRGE